MQETNYAKPYLQRPNRCFTTLPEWPSALPKKPELCFTVLKALGHLKRSVLAFHEPGKARKPFEKDWFWACRLDDISLERTLCRFVSAHASELVSQRNQEKQENHLKRSVLVFLETGKAGKLFENECLRVCMWSASTFYSMFFLIMY